MAAGLKHLISDKQIEIPLQARWVYQGSNDNPTISVCMVHTRMRLRPENETAQPKHLHIAPQYEDQAPRSAQQSQSRLNNWKAFNRAGCTRPLPGEPKLPERLSRQQWHSWSCLSGIFEAAGKGS